MLIPYNTDAPLYHPPFATVATIVLNVLLFVPIFSQDDPYGLYEESEIVVSEEEFPDMQEVPDFDSLPDSGRAMPEMDGKVIEGWDSENVRAPGGITTLGGRNNIWRLMTIQYGKFRPWQWLTANYMHIDTLHLVGNMFVELNGFAC